MAEIDTYYTYGASAEQLRFLWARPETIWKTCLIREPRKSSYRNSGRCDQSRTLIIKGLGFKALNMWPICEEPPIFSSIVHGLGLLPCLVVIHVVVGDWDEGRTANGVDQSISSFGQGAVVDPDVVCREDADGIAVGSPALSHMGLGAHYLAGPLATMSWM